MAEYIEKEALYSKVAELEMLARDRYLETPTNSPVYPRYMAQLGERTHLKFLIADFPAADVVEVVRCRDCKNWKHLDHIGCTDFVKLCKWGGYMVGANGYCVYGERRNGDATVTD